MEEQDKEWIEAEALRYARIGYAKAPLQSQEDAEYIIAVSSNSFIAGATAYATRTAQQSENKDAKESARLFAESQMAENWDRKDHIHISVFYNHMVNYLVDTAQDYKQLEKENEELRKAHELIIRALSGINDTVTNDIIRISKQALNK